MPNSELLVITCLWFEDFDGDWFTACGERASIFDGTPPKNGMRYCCYCGLPLNALPYHDPQPEDDLDKERAHERMTENGIEMEIDERRGG